MTTRSLIQRDWQVRALLEGRRTRVSVPVHWPVRSLSDGAKRRIFVKADAAEVNALLAEPGRHPHRRIDCPLGRAGGLLRVRETFAYATDPFAATVNVLYRADLSRRSMGATEGLIPDGATVYNFCAPDFPGNVKWRSPATMPAWAVRPELSALRVLDVRCHLVREISPEDAIAEGATSRPACSGYQSQCDGWSMDWSQVGEHSRWARGGPGPLKEVDVSMGTAHSAFGLAWCEMHGKDSWERDWCFAATVESASP